MSLLSWLGLTRPIVADPPPPSDYARKVLYCARLELGNGEEEGNNHGTHLDRYRAGGPGGPWCAAFVSHCLETASEMLWGDRWKRYAVVRSHGAKKLFNNALRVGARVECPLPGDLVLWHRGAKGARTGHIGIVSLYRDNVFWSVEGNRGGYPSKVREYMHELGEALLLGFCRLP